MKKYITIFTFSAIGSAIYFYFAPDIFIFLLPILTIFVALIIDVAKGITKSYK